MTPPPRMRWRRQAAAAVMAMVVVTAAALLAACAGTPAPVWQASASADLQRAVAAVLGGDSRLEATEFARARSAIARTGRPDLLARATLVRCAAHVASLEIDACGDFEPLRADAQAPERAYAEYLSGRPLPPADVALLPAQHRKLASAATAEATLAALRGIDDPLARLVAAAVALQSGRASPAAIALAVDTASAQGWRRPLLAWLELQALRTTQAGDTDATARLRRRIEIVQGAR